MKKGKLDEAEDLGTDANMYRRVTDCRGEHLLHAMYFGIAPLRRSLPASGGDRRYEDAAVHLNADR